jgi:uncharacterized protein
MKIAVTGASGLIGSALVPALRADGHDVVRLVRRSAVSPDEVTWLPETGYVDLAGLAGVDALIHLAAAGAGDHRWTEAYKRTFLRSRVDGTRTIATAVAALDPRPSVLVCASAIGYYGDTGDREVDETSPKGSGFPADVAEQWEQAADPAREAGVRVVHSRTGLVVSRSGGAWGRMLPIFRLGLGGRLGTGRQWWSVVSLDDAIAGLTWMLTSDAAGPVNLTGPEPATNAQVTEAMGRALHRPTILPVPEFAIRVALGEFSIEVLSSKRVLPKVLERAGFDFAHPTIDDAIAAIT